MLTVWIIIGLVPWVPLLFYGIERRGFAIMLLWLLVAPIVGNVMDYRGGGFLTSQESEQEILQPSGFISDSISKRDWQILIDPNRLLFGSFGMVFFLQALLKKKRLGPFDKAEKLMVVFSFILLSSLLYRSETIGYNARVVADDFVAPFLAYFVARRLTTSEMRLRQLIRVLGYVGTYLLLMAAIQGIMTDIPRVTGPFQHRDLLYVVLIVVFFAVLSNYLGSWKASENRQALRFWIRLLVIGLTPIVVLLTWTRGNWLGFGLGLWVFFVLGIRLMNFRRRLVSVSFVGLLIPLIFAAWGEFSPSEYAANRVSNERTIYARLAAWQVVLSAAIDNPIFGVGLGNTRTLLSSTTERFEDTKNLQSTHNSFLALFGDLGAIGLLAFLAVVVSVIQMGLSLYRNGRDYQERWNGVAITALMTAHLLPAVFSNILFSPGLSHSYVFAYIGGIAGLYGHRRQRRAHQYVRNTQAAKEPLMIPNPSGI